MPLDGVCMQAVAEELRRAKSKVTNSVLCPGSVLGPHAQVYPTSCVRGLLPASHIWKGKDNIVPRLE